jgi:hypothetical protein
MEVNVGDYTIPYLMCENIQRLCMPWPYSIQAIFFIEIHPRRG